MRTTEIANTTYGQQICESVIDYIITGSKYEECNSLLIHFMHSIFVVVAFHVNFNIILKAIKTVFNSPADL